MFEYIYKINKLEEIKYASLGTIENFNSFKELEQLSKQQNLNNPKIIIGLKFKESKDELIYQIYTEQDFNWVKNVWSLNPCSFVLVYIVDGNKYIA